MITPSTKRERVGAERLAGSLWGAHEVLGELFDQGKLPRTGEVARALDELKYAQRTLAAAVQQMQGRT